MARAMGVKDDDEEEEDTEKTDLVSNVHSELPELESLTQKTVAKLKLLFEKN